MTHASAMTKLDIPLKLNKYDVTYYLFILNVAISSYQGTDT